MKILFKLVSVLFFVGIITSCMEQKDINNASSKEEAVLENIANRKSVRKYQARGIEQEKIDALLKAGMAAPSGMDRRPWEFMVVNDRSALDAMAAALPYAKMLANVQEAIIVCGDSTKSSYWYLDCSAATQNILLAAEALGLGAVWTAAYPYEDRMGIVREHTNMPGHIMPLCVIPIGYPDGETASKDKYDKSRIHYNVY